MKKYPLRSSVTMLLLALLSFPWPAPADIFRLEDEEGVISFTDTPNDSRYTRILRDNTLKRVRTKPSSTMVPSGDGIASVPAQRPAMAELPIQGVITSPPGLRFDPFDGKLRHHNGFDIATPTGTPVKPVGAGTVLFSGWRSGYGNTVIIDHHDGMVTVYAHHANNMVSEGAVVDRSTVIALSGSTGRSTGPHLHFEAWRDGENITYSFAPPGSIAARAAVPDAPIRRHLQADGTILFTNLR